MAVRRSASQRSHSQSPAPLVHHPLSLWVELVIVFQNPIQIIAPSPSSPSSTCCCCCNSTIFFHHFLQLVCYCNSTIFLHHLLQLVVTATASPAVWLMHETTSQQQPILRRLFVFQINCMCRRSGEVSCGERERERREEKRSDKTRPD